MSDQLIDQLRTTRDDYEAECVWHRFLLDAYTGTGGFAGKVKPPQSGYLGWAAEVYASNTGGAVSGGGTGDTYLDRFPREDDPKFARRCEVAHYVNYVGPICDLFSSYLAGQPPTRDGVEDNKELSDWMQNADGRGTTWNELRDETIVPRALQLGWAPVMFDRDETPPGVTSKAQEKALKLGTRAIPLFPGNVPEWEVDDAGSLVWAKVVLSYCEKPDPLGPKNEYDKVLIWTREHVSEFRITEGEGGKEKADIVRDKQPHSFGCVPIIIFRAGKTPDDPVRGTSIIGAVAVENRRHFNLLSELDEHLRSVVFALLQVPVPTGTTAPAELTPGNGNAVPVPADATQGYEFIAPPGTVAATYENRLKESSREIYRIASAPYESDSGAAQSGVARAYQFEATNKRLVKISTGVASAEQRSLQLVSKSQGANEETVNAIRCSPPADFRVDDLSVDLDNLIKAISVAGMAATAKMLVILRATQKMLPNMHADDRKKIEDELKASRDKALLEPEPQQPPKVEPPVPGSEDPNKNQGGDQPPNQQQAA